MDGRVVLITGAGKRLGAATASRLMDEGCYVLIHVRSSTDSAKTLIEAGADVDKATNEGATPLNIAADEGHLETVKVLLKAGANLDPVDDWGDTALSAAKSKGHNEVVRVLEEAAAAAGTTEGIAI